MSSVKVDLLHRLLLCDYIKSHKEITILFGNILILFLRQEQYHFLHMALVECLMLSSSAMPASNFLQAYDELLTYDETARCLGIQREFEVIFITLSQKAFCKMDLSRGLPDNVI